MDNGQPIPEQPDNYTTRPTRIYEPIPFPMVCAGLQPGIILPAFDYQDNHLTYDNDDESDEDRSQLDEMSVIENEDGSRKEAYAPGFISADGFKSLAAFRHIEYMNGNPVVAEPHRKYCTDADFKAMVNKSRQNKARIDKDAKEKINRLEARLKGQHDIDSSNIRKRKRLHKP